MKQILVIVLFVVAVTMAFAFAYRLLTPPNLAPEHEAPVAPASAQQSKQLTPPSSIPAADTAPAPAAVSAPAEVPEPPVEQQAGLSFYGVVQDAETAAPVPGAAIQLLYRNEEKVSSTSEATGEFSITLQEANLDAEALLLSCTAEGFARLLKPVKSLGTAAPGEKIRVDLVLLHGAQLTGRVFHAKTQQPVAGATVKVWTKEAGWPPVQRQENPEQQATSGEDGAYQFTTLSPGAYHLTAVPSEQNLVTESPEDMVFTVKEKESLQRDLPMVDGATLSGTITTADGGQIQDKTHAAVLPAGEDFMRRIQSLSRGIDHDATVKEDGSYEVTRLRFDTLYKVTAGADEYAAVTSDAFSIAPGASPYRLDLVLTRGSTIRGAVTHQDASPAPEIRVTVMPDMSKITSGEFGGFDLRDKSDDKGSFEIKGVPEGKYTLMAEGTSFPFTLQGENKSAQQVEVDGVNDVEGITLVISDANADMGSIEGIVLGEDNKPLPAAKVQARINGMARSEASTDGEGKFVLAKLAPGSYDLRARTPDGEAEADKVATGSKVTLKLGPSTKVSGLVVDTEGNPAGDCRVRLEKQYAEDVQPGELAPTMFEDMMDIEGNTSKTNEYGFFEFNHVREGDYVARALASGRGMGKTDAFSVQKGASISDLKISLDRGRRFAGTVVDGSGKALPGTTLSLSLAASGNPFQQQMAQFMPANMQESAGETISDERGAFALEVPGGSYRLTASHTGFASTTVDLEIDPLHDLLNYTVNLSQGGCLAGTPLMKGEPKPGLTVQIMGNGMQMSSTNDEGRFEVCGLAPGKYIVQVMDMGAMMSGNMAGMMPIQRSAEVVDGQTTEVPYAPAEGAVSVSGTVTGNRGTMTTITFRNPDSPAPGEIDTFDIVAQMEMMENLGGTTMVQPDGTYTIDSIAPGHYILEVFSMNFDPQNMDIQELTENARKPRISQEVTVEPDQPLTLDLQLPAE